MITFCTLFDSNYLDRGVTLHESLLKVCSDFHLYILAFDNACFYALQELCLPSVTVISLAEFETPQLLEIKPLRNHSEYCWTCSSFLIKHVLTHYSVDYCTYIDADMYFFSNPVVLLQEIINSDCQTSLVKHQFGHNSYARHSEKLNGKYCVQFNTFRNTPESLAILDWWGEQCLKDCNSDYSNGQFGDQKYLNDWTTRFENVYEIQCLGAGVANWNLYRYRLVSIPADGQTPILFDKVTHDTFPLIFYHFHGLRFTENTVDVGLYTEYGRKDSATIRYIFQTYLSTLIRTRKELSVKGLFSLPQSPASHSIPERKTFRQKIEEKKALVKIWGPSLMIYTVLKSHFMHQKNILSLDALEDM